VGGRHLNQDFTDSQSYSVYTFNSYVPAIARDSSVGKNIFKVNPSYQYTEGQFVYATWSQGFRRGGASSVPLTGPFQESPRLATYAPDSTNNYETGLKGRVGGFTYTADIFDIYWDNPQIAGVTPAGNYAVWNANKARSDGAELNLSGPLVVTGLSFSLGGAYTNAKLTEDYALPAGNGGGMVVPGLISGKSGSQLPGSPKTSATATLTYQTALVPGYNMTSSLNGSYKSQIPFTILIPGTPPSESDSIMVMNLSFRVDHDAWNVGAYVNNLADRRSALAPASGPEGNLYHEETIMRPREIGLRLGYSF
jgi:outer membrane receptor protein involved in Fe transport